MQVTPITCTACSKGLFEAVRFCPYCGVATASPSAIRAKVSSTPVSPAQAETERNVDKTSGSDKPQATEGEPPLLPAPKPTAVSASPVATTAPVPPQRKTSPSPLPLPAEDEPAAAPEAPREPSRSKLPVAIVAALMVIVAGYLLSGPTDKEVACDMQLALAAEMLAAGDAVGARGQSVLALASCNADSRSKANELQAAADKALVLRANCEKNLRRAESLIGEHRLQSAISTIDELDNSCSDVPQTKTLHLLLDAGQSAAASAEAETRQKLASSDLKGARVSLDQLSAVNREHPEIAALRVDIQNALKAQDDAAAADAASAAAVAAATAADAATAAVVPAPPKPAVVEAPVRNNATFTAQNALVNGFLRDAEIALSELKFDKAKTYVESARRIDPANSQAVFLARQIKNRELEYARKEMTIN